MHPQHELFTRRFGYAHRLPACPAIGRPEGPDEKHDDGLLVAHGPSLAMSAFGGENYYAMIVGGMQSDRSNCVLVRAIVDGPVETWTLEGDLDDSPGYFREFLSLMPPGLAGAVRDLHQTLRADLDG